MKLSEMKGQEFSTALCELCLAIDALCADEDVKQCILQNANNPALARVDILKIIPALMNERNRARTLHMLCICAVRGLTNALVGI